MKKYAIDVVLLPPKKITDWCVKVSKKYSHLDKHPFPLNPKDNLPHVSLYMGVISGNNLLKLTKRLDKILVGVRPIKIKPTKLKIFQVVGEPMYSMTIGRSKKLHQLHEKILGVSVSITNHRPTNKMYLKKPGDYFDPKTPNHLINFLIKSSYKNYNPHITLRTGKAVAKKLPDPFLASTLAICHMGNRSTSRKILYQYNLKK